MSKVMWKDREVLKINEMYVEGYGWITEEWYQYIMYNVDKSPATMVDRITQRNIQYQLPDGKTGQMDIEEKDFWLNRTFVSDKEVTERSVVINESTFSI